MEQVQMSTNNKKPVTGWRKIIADWLGIQTVTIVQKPPVYINGGMPVSMFTVNEQQAQQPTSEQRKRRPYKQSPSARDFYNEVASRESWDKLMSTPSWYNIRYRVPKTKGTKPWTLRIRRDKANGNRNNHVKDRSFRTQKQAEQFAMELVNIHCNRKQKQAFMNNALRKGF
jgi:hypothetical protein